MEIVKCYTCNSVVPQCHCNEPEPTKVKLVNENKFNDFVKALRSGNFRAGNL